MNRKLKVLHICTTDKGGAGLCCLRIHKALLDEGIDSKVLTLNKKSKNVPGVYQYGNIRRYGTWSMFFKAEANKMLRIIGIYFTDRSRIKTIHKHTGIVTTLPISTFDLTQNPLVQEADIIHLHWIGNFVDLPSFFKKIKKPVVWTLHDENLFHGIFHYDPGKYKDDPIEKKYYQIKKWAVGNADRLGIVFLSKMMYDKFANESIIKGRPTTIINNSVDYNKFHPIDKAKARKVFEIPNDKIVFSFVTGRIGNPRKGLNILSETLQKMNIDNAYILAAGNDADYTPAPLVHPVGTMTDSESLSAAYSCSDYFVMPSSQEAFGLTSLEAMACGVPAIVFPVGCCMDLINPQNGVCTKGFTPNDLEAALRQAMNTKYEADAIRQDVINRFSPSAIANKYIAFYNRMLNS